MSKRLKSQHSFLAGEWSPLLYSRSDVQNYSEALKTHTNRYTHKLGPSIKRTGTKYIQDVNDETARPRMWSFIDDDGDNVTLEFGKNYVVAYENEVAVGSVLTTTYSEAEVELLSISQFKNKIYCAVGGKNLRIITYSGGGSMSIADATWSSAPTTTQPDIVFLYQQRLGLIDSSELLIEFSKSGVLNDFTTGSSADDGFTISLAMNGASTIKGVSIARHIVIHTESAEFTIEGTGTGGYIGPPNDYKIEARETKGTNSNRNAVTGQDTLFIGRTGRSVERFYYDFAIDAFNAVTISDPADHLFTSQIKEIVFSEISRRIFTVLDEGVMICGTFIRGQNSIAWSKFTFDGIVESVAVSQNDENQENIYIAIKRTIDGNTVRYIELFDTGDGDDIRDSFLDSSKKFGSTVTGATIYPVAKVKGGTLYTGGTTINNIVKGAGTTKITLDASVTSVFDVGDNCIIKDATGTLELPDALNSDNYIITQIDSGTEFWINTDLNGVNGTITASTGRIYVHKSVTVVADTGHALNTGDYVNNEIFNAPSNLSSEYEAEHVITKQDSNHWSIEAGVFTSENCGVSYSLSYSPRLSSISGLSHLEGETVRVKLDGNDIGDHEVSSGEITLNTPGYLGVVGVKYTATLITLPFDLGNPNSSALGQPSARVNTLIHVYNSMSPVVEGNQVPIRRYEDRLDSALPLYTGFLDYGPTKWSNNGTLTITDSSPNPSIITGIFGTVVSNNK